MPIRITYREVLTNGVLMTALGSVLFSMEPLLTNPDTEQFGYLLSVVLTALVLIVVGFRFWKNLSADDQRLKAKSILLAHFLIACWVLVWLIRSAPLDLRGLVLLVGMHSILWGLWLLKLATQVREHKGSASLVIGLLAALSSAAGSAIAVEAGLSRITALTLAACYMTWIGIIILSFALYAYRALVPPKSSLSTKARQESETAFHVATT